MNKYLKNRLLFSAILQVHNLSIFFKKTYSHSLLSQLIKICNFFSACKCTYVRFDSESGRFQISKRTHFWVFCVTTILCILLTLLQICELLIKKKSIIQCILFFITISVTICGGVSGAFYICQQKLLILILNWITPILNSMNASMHKQ